MLREEKIHVDRGPLGPYPMIIGVCDLCGRRRMYNTAIVGPPAHCVCQDEADSFEKKEMLLVDRLEPYLAELDYRNPVMVASRYSRELPYYAAGLEMSRDVWVFINLGRLPLGNETPTFLYLIAFPDWHGEKFMKVGIGLIGRLRAHERHGGQVLEAIELPRWQARIAEAMILSDCPSFRPRVPLPQHGSTECMLWDFGKTLRLSRYVKRSAVKAM